MSATAAKLVNSSSSALVDNRIGSPAKNVIFCCQQNGSSTATPAEPTKKSVKVVEPATGKDKATTAPTRKQGTPVRKTANHDTNHAKRSRSPEPNTSSSSSSSSASSEGTESSTPSTAPTSTSSSSTPAVPAAAPAPKPAVAAAPEPPTIKGSGPNGELTLKDIPVSGISFQEVYNPEHEGPPTTKVIIYKPKSGKGQPTAKVIVTKVLD